MDVYHIDIMCTRTHASSYGYLVTYAPTYARACKRTHVQHIPLLADDSSYSPLTFYRCRDNDVRARSRTHSQLIEAQARTRTHDHHVPLLADDDSIILLSWHWYARTHSQWWVFHSRTRIRTRTQEHFPCRRRQWTDDVRVIVVVPVVVLQW